MNPLDLSGPDFLVGYAAAATLATAALFLGRWWLRRDASTGRDAVSSLGNYEIAWLRGGARGMVRTAIARLHLQKLIEIRDRAVVRRASGGGGDLHAVERAVFSNLSVGPMAAPAALEAVVEPERKQIEGRLMAMGLALRPEHMLMARVLPALGLASCLVVGAAKLGLGISRGRPVGLLVLALAATASVVVWALAAKPRRTTAGDRALAVLADRHAALRTMAKAAPAQLEPQDAARAVALWGTAALVSLHLTFEPHRAWADTDGWFSAGFGGGGDGDGGGGGGDGGGGCGGCGGGGD